MGRGKSKKVAAEKASLRKNVEFYESANPGYAGHINFHLSILEEQHARLRNRIDAEYASLAKQSARLDALAVRRG
jgi:hypothetical protein